MKRENKIFHELFLYYHFKVFLLSKRHNDVLEALPNNDLNHFLSKSVHIFNENLFFCQIFQNNS